MIDAGVTLVTIGFLKKPFIGNTHKVEVTPESVANAHTMLKRE